MPSFHRYQCFKSAWVYEVFHSGFSFPRDYENLKTALLVYDKEVQWTLGAILYRTRFLPLRYGEIRSLKVKESLRFITINVIYSFTMS